jgi:phosphatidylserine/phosphatidylglycerophosphate/cardiolipin synthase-like enzyme
MDHPGLKFFRIMIFLFTIIHLFIPAKAEDKNMISVRTYPEKIYAGIHKKICIDAYADKNKLFPVSIKPGRSLFGQNAKSFSYKDSSNQRRVCTCIEIPSNIKPDVYVIPFEIVLKNQKKIHDSAAIRIAEKKADSSPDILSEKNRSILEHYYTSPVTLGNRVDVLYDGPSSFLKFKEILESAQHSIHLQTFLLDNKGKSADLFNILKEKARNGVDVKVLLTRYSQLGKSPGVYLDLKMNGIDFIMIGDISLPREKVIEYTPWHKIMQDQFLMLRNLPSEMPFTELLMKQNPEELVIEYALHEKMIIVDGRRAITGGRNISDNYFFWWKDMDLYLEGPAVNALDSEFRSNWIEFGGDISIEEPLTMPTGSENGFPVGIADSKPWKGNYTTVDMLCTAIGMAKESIFITTQYIALPEKLSVALKHAALRGIDVRILTNSNETGQEVAFSLCHYISLNYYRDLLAAGVRIYEYQSPKNTNQKPYYHAKLFIIDGLWASIGSFNLSTRSAFLESEIQVNIPDGSFARARQDTFIQELAANSREISFDDFAREEEKFGPLMNAAKLVELLY